MCKVCNGDKLHYESFDELPQELKDKFKPNRVTKQTKDGYIKFINKLIENGESFIGVYTKAFDKVVVQFSCGHSHDVLPSNYTRNHGCGICNGKIVVKGINDIATTDPDLVKYFANVEDAYTHTRCSDKRVDMICPNCDYKKEDCVKTLATRGFSCPECGDGVPYTEKVFANFLNYLIKQGVIDYYTKQKRFNGYNYLYDFALYKNNKIIAIVETHGGQHYKQVSGGNWRTLEDEQANDNAKEQLANDNGYITNEKYFIIDCRKSDIKWISNSIKTSRLIEKLNIDLKNINWEDVDKKSQCSLKWEVVTKWMERKSEDMNLTPRILADELGMNYATVQKYLKWGNEHVKGCCYNVEEELGLNNKRLTKYSVYFLNPQGEKIYEDATSITELARRTNLHKTTLGKNIGQPLGTKKGANNIKFDKKYIGCRVVLADEWDSQQNKEKSDTNNN